MPTPNDPCEDVSSELPTRVLRILKEFEDAWQKEGPPGLDRFLPVDEAERLVALPALVQVDLERRFRAGEAIRVERYLECYPELAQDSPRLVSLLAAEFSLRRRHEPGLQLTEYQARFPKHAPALALRCCAAVDSGEGPALNTPREQILNPPGEASSFPTPVSKPEELPGSYEILGELGRGGMGVVYKARNLSRGNLVALKTLPWADPKALYRFKQEFRSLAGVSHPNLVSLYELISDGRIWFFTMELVEGIDFLTYVRPPGSSPEGATSSSSARESGGLAKAVPPNLESPSPECLVNIGRLRAALRQLAEGVQALHQAGKLHRDLKPSNVLVSGARWVVLLDFGLAAELDARGLHQSTEHGFVGTVAFMAPEQAAGLPVSPASDWYSVGVMLYQALTGRLPFEGSALEILRDKQLRDPPSPVQLVPDLPEDLHTLCTRLLSRDPTGRPGGADVLSLLRDTAAQPPDTGLLSSPLEQTFVGREEHLQALDSAFQAMRQGRALAVFVQGRSGAGKSALLQRFCDSVNQLGQAVVLCGRCYEHETVPYKALDSLIDALSRYLHRLPLLEAQALLPRDILQLARLFPVLRQVEAVTRAPVRSLEVPDPQELRRRAFGALRELLGRLGDRRPLVLVIDDLQWGDVDSAALLTDLLLPPDPPVFLLLGCFRSEDVAKSPCLRVLLQASKETNAVERRLLTVEALTLREARDLASRLLPSNAPTESWAEAIARESGGSPFFIYELALAARGGPWSSEPFAPSGPRALNQVLWDRVQRLPEEARRLLEVVAVSGRPLSQAEACAAARLPPKELSVLTVLRSGRLLRSTGQVECEEIETYHDRIREAVVGQLSTKDLQACHRNLATALEASGRADPEALAVHFQGAGELEKAGLFYAQAADRAAEALAFDRAAHLFRMALELRPGRGEEECRLRTQRGDALANAGRGSEAASEYLAAAAGAQDSLELRRRAALQLLGSGHVDEGSAVLQTVLKSVGLKLPPTPRRALWSLTFRRIQLRLRGLSFGERHLDQVPIGLLSRINICWSAGAGLSGIDPIRAFYFQTLHLLYALRAGEPYHLARALALEGAHASMAGGPGQHRTARLLQLAQSLAGRVHRPYAEGIVSLASGIAAYFEGRWKIAYGSCAKAEGIFRDHCTGATWELDTAQNLCLYALCYLGELAQLERCLPGKFKEAKDRNDLYLLANLGSFMRPLVGMAADRPEESRRDLNDLLDQWSRQGFHIIHANAVGRLAEIDLYEGQGHAAHQRATDLWRGLKGGLLIRIQHLRICTYDLHARSTLAIAEKGRKSEILLRDAERDARKLEREKAPFGIALAGLIRAAIAANRGAKPLAIRLLTQADSQFETLHMRLHAAAVRRRLGSLLGGEMGRAFVSSADAWMAGQQIVNPARMTAVLAPGFPE